MKTAFVVSATLTVKVPKRFYDDHVSRDLLAGNVLRSSGAYYVVEMDDETFKDLMSDADYYATMPPGEMDSSYRGLIQSAQATVRALKAAQSG